MTDSVMPTKDNARLGTADSMGVGLPSTILTKVCNWVASSNVLWQPQTLKVKSQVLADI